MENNYIWSESLLREMIGRPEPEVQEWALITCFMLYPDSTIKDAAALLRTGRPDVVRTVLNLLPPDEIRDDLVPVLKDLYMDGPPALSAAAIRVLGLYGIGEAVQWMEESILADRALTGEQIDAMIGALENIASESAYGLLKKTEEGIESGDPLRWKSFYRALLAHRRAEDVETVVRAFLDAGTRDDRRRNALELLAAHVAPAMNPSNIIFGHHSGTAVYLDDRLEYIESETRALPDGESLPPVVDELQEFIRHFHPDSLQDGVAFILAREEEQYGMKENARHEREVFRIMKNHLSGGVHSPEDRLALFLLATCALVGALMESYLPAPPEDAHWKERVTDLLRDRYPKLSDRALQDRTIAEAPSSELIPILIKALHSHPFGWGAVRAVGMLGKLRALESTPVMVRAVARNHDGLFCAEVRKALIRMGTEVAGDVIALLNSPDPVKAGLALTVLARIPVPEVVQELAARLPAFLESHSEDCLDAIEAMPAKEFLPILENEYRPGEWELGEMFVLICRVNGLTPPNLREVEQDVRNGREYLEPRRKIESGDHGWWPDSVRLRMLCRACGKRYHYLAHEIHLHLQTDNSEGKGAGAKESDMTPYRQGIVIGDDLQCKNCGRVNDMELTPEAFSVLTAESIKMLFYHKSGLSVPRYYPVQPVKFGEKDGEPQTLSQLEQEYLQEIGRQPAKARGHITLGKFYEYVKVHRKARDSYLKAIDLDAVALEAIAGLARLCHAEGRHVEALEWIESCYDNLSGGNLYLVPDPRDFKKVVREKRREYARDAGIRLKDEPVEIRFKAEDAADHPKNRPCPCGSGKKYKLCCMKKE